MFYFKWCFGRINSGEAQATAERRVGELVLRLNEAASERDVLQQAQQLGSAEASERVSSLEVRSLPVL